jgi:hypothetical protein
MELGSRLSNIRWGITEVTTAIVGIIATTYSVFYNDLTTAIPIFQDIISDLQWMTYLAEGMMLLDGTHRIKYEDETWFNGSEWGAKKPEPIAANPLQQYANSDQLEEKAKSN